MKIKGLIAAGLVALSLLLPAQVRADSVTHFTQVYEENGITLKISNEPCKVQKVLDGITDDSLRSKVKTAVATWPDGKEYLACSLVYTDRLEALDGSGDVTMEFVVAVDVDGDAYGPIPLSEFRDIEGSTRAPQGAR